MNDTKHSQSDAWLDLLADQVAKRIQARTPSQVEALPTPSPIAPADKPNAQTVSLSEPEPERTMVAEAEPSPAPPAPSHAATLMARLMIGIFIAIILINIPLNAQGTALARSIPHRASLIIADGLLIKEETSPDVWVYKQGAFHWITSIDAFEHLGYRWENVQIVTPGFLEDFEKGKPIYVLLKCDYSPHIYRLDAGSKRWIVDIPTFQAEGHIWSDVRLVPCDYLRSFPDGDSIPPGRGTPSSQLP